MAIRTYLYRPLSLTAADLSPLLAGSASPVVGAPLPDNRVPITIDDSHKIDLDEAMESFGYIFIEEYTGGVPLTSRADYGVLASNPTGVTAGNGDMYYNSTLDMEMRYDSVRGKWLSVESAEFHFGRDGNVGPGMFFRAADGRVMSPTLGWYAFRSGTVVAFAYTRADSDASTFEITAGGANLHTVASASTAGRDLTPNADFSFGSILSVRNVSGGSTMSNVIGWARIKWRV